jgi:hypothetical protein
MRSWIHSNECIGDFALVESTTGENGVFYEQVTNVKGLFFAFFFIGLLLLLLFLVSLLSTGFLFALCMSCLEAGSVPVGVREESRCCHLSVGLGRPKRSRSHRNTVSSQRVKRIILRPLARRTACTVVACSRGDGARRPACVLLQRRLYSSLAYHLLRLSADPTVAAPSLVHVVAGCGWSTRSADFGYALPAWVMPS